jgi:hypothetical protein
LGGFDVPFSISPVCSGPCASFRLGIKANVCSAQIRVRGCGFRALSWMGDTSGQLCPSVLATLTADTCSSHLSIQSRNGPRHSIHLQSSRWDLAFDRRALKSGDSGIEPPKPTTHLAVVRLCVQYLQHWAAKHPGGAEFRSFVVVWLVV